MQRLGILVIYAKCPEGKERIERSFKTHQDRMIKKMRLLGIKTPEDATRYFREIYRDNHNKQFGEKAREEGDMHVPLSEEEQKNFKRYFALETERVIRKDGTVWYGNKSFQIKKGEVLYNGKTVIVKEAMDGEVKIFSGKVALEVTSKKIEYR